MNRLILTSCDISDLRTFRFPSEKKNKKKKTRLEKKRGRKGENRKKKIKIINIKEYTLIGIITELVTFRKAFTGKFAKAAFLVISVYILFQHNTTATPPYI